MRRLIYLRGIIYLNTLESTDNIIILSALNADYIDITKQSRKLIIIDGGEQIINDQLVDAINSDRGVNGYLIMCRKTFGFDISPNYYGKLVCTDKNKISLEYSYNVRGWY